MNFLGIVSAVSWPEKFMKLATVFVHAMLLATFQEQLHGRGKPLRGA